QGGNGIGSIIVNGIPASGGSATGDGVSNWSASVQLFLGTNVITVTATDTGGNATTKTVQVVYDQFAPFLVVSSPDSAVVTTNPLPVFGTATDAGHGDAGIASVI